MNEAQKEELEVLSHIYAQLHVDPASSPPTLRLRLHADTLVRLTLPADYPAHAPPLLDVVSSRLAASDAERRRVRDALPAFVAGEPCVFAWIEAVRDATTPLAGQPSAGAAAARARAHTHTHTHTHTRRSVASHDDVSRAARCRRSRKQPRWLRMRTRRRRRRRQAQPVQARQRQQQQQQQQQPPPPQRQQRQRSQLLRVRSSLRL